MMFTTRLFGCRLVGTHQGASTRMHITLEWKRSGIYMFESGVKGRWLVHKADDLTAICEPAV
jgi:hypothetical protein